MSPTTMSADSAVQAVRRAEGAFDAWSALGPNARRAVLSAAADRLASMADEFVASMAEETGATEGWARFNVGLAADMLREAAALTTAVRGQTIPSDHPGTVALTLRVPVGVVLGIAPWNAPVILGVRAIATALACGNTVVLKASEVCPRTHGLIVEAIERSGAPADIVTLVTNEPADAAEVVGALIDDRAVRRVNFTGSTRVGRTIAERAARNLKPVLLELGGKAPFLVLADADLDEAVKAAAFGSFMNQGQICMSTERIIVVDDVADEFVTRFAAKAETMLTGPSGPLGALVSESAADTTRRLIEDAVGKGARLVAGGPGEGRTMPANIVDGVREGMALYRDESFGPVVSVIRARDTEEAVRIANDSEYGLSSAVFTSDVGQALRVARAIDAGMCHINGATVNDEAQMPFGGVKGSGYGRFGGEAGIAEFTDLKWVTIETEPGHFPI
ncbi:aldehyde dehydrogenase [Okibacterium endophyticum]